MLTNPGYKIKLLGEWYEEGDGFSFVDDPKITIKRNHTERAIYEVPALDFVAIGSVYEALDQEIRVNGICNNLPIDFYRNEELIFSGHIKSSAVTFTLNDDEAGTFASVPIIDNNYNSYFVSFRGVAIDVDSPYDLECNIIDPPEPHPILLFEPQAPVIVTTYDRNLFKVAEVLEHVVNMITRGNVTLISDFFTTGDGSRFYMCTGDAFKFEFSLRDLLVTYEDLARTFGRLENLWAWYYQSGGQQYVRIEPAAVFLDDKNRITIDNINGLRIKSKPERLYATARVGTDDGLDDSFNEERNFLPFELDELDEQIVHVGNDCSTDAQLDLTVPYIYHTNRIHNQLLDADNPDRDKIFLVETDGAGNAITYFGDAAGSNYYNGRWLNGKVLARHFDGLGPISAFPEGFDEIDYFQGYGTVLPAAGVGNLAADLSVAGGGENLQIDSLFLYLGGVNRDVNGALDSSQMYAPTMGGTSLALVPMTRFICVTPFSYSFTLKIPIRLDFAVTAGDPVEIRIQLQHVSGGTTFYYSDWIPMGNTPGSITTRTIEYKSPDIPCIVGDIVRIRIISKTFFAQAGAISVALLPPSAWEVSPCPQFISKFEAEGLKSFVYEGNFDGRPLESSVWEGFRSDPGKIFQIISEPYQLMGYCEEITYNYKSGFIGVIITGDQIYERV